jgi:hypothetical protein
MSISFMLLSMKKDRHPTAKFTKSVMSQAPTMRRRATAAQSSGSCVTEVPPTTSERDRGDRDRHEDAHGHRGQALGRVRPERVDGAQQAHAEGTVAHLEVHLVEDPGARELADDERGEEVRDELRLPVAADRTPPGALATATQSASMTSGIVVASIHTSISAR